MRKLKLLFAACALWLGVGQTWAQTDVTSTYITNADFSSCEAFGTGNAAAGNSAAGTDYESTGWKLVTSAAWCNSAVFEYGSGGQINGRLIPAQDPFGNTGKGMAFTAGWGGNQTYQSATAVTLPAGTYTLVAPTFNALAGATQLTSKLGFIPTEGGAFLSTKNSFSSWTWEYDVVTFTLGADTEGKFQFGGTAISGGSTSNAIIIVDRLTLYEGEYTPTSPFTGNAYRYGYTTVDLLTNGSFDENNKGWTLSNMGYQQNGERPTRYVEKWQQNALSGSGSASQTLNNMPAGVYIFNGFANTNKTESGGAKINVGTTSINVSGSWKEYSIIYNHESAGDLTVSFTYSNLASNWVAIDGFSLVYGGDFTAYEATMHKGDWDNAVVAANDALANDDYINVIGTERTAVEDELEKAEPTTAQGYDDAVANLIAATSAFTAAKTNYDIFATYNTTLTYADADKEPTITSESTAATILPALRAYYESHALAEGDATAIDYTSHLTNYNNPSNTDGWTITNTTGNSNMRIMNSESYTDADGTNNHSYFDSNSWGSAFATTFTQSVTLPAGTYLFTAKARGNGTTTYKVIAGEEGTDITAIGNTGGVFDRGWNDYSVEFTVASEGAVALGIQMETGSSSNWLSFGNFRLMKIDNTLADDTDYSNLTAAITAAEAKTLGFENEEYAPYNNAMALAKLAEAKAINQSAKNEQSVVQGLTTYLNTAGNWTANSGDVDAIYNGLFATVAEGQNYPDGWTRTNGWGQMQSGISGDYATAYYNQPGSLQYGNQGVYTMPLAANTIYRLSFAYRSHENGSNQGVTASVLKGEDGLSNTDFPANGSTSDWKTASAFFTTGAAGNYVLTLANSGNTWMTNVSLVKVDALEFADGSVPTYAPGTYPSVKITRTLSANKWATSVYPFAVSGENIQIAVLDSYDSTVDGGTLGFATATSSTPNVPFLMRSTAGTTEITLSNVAVAAATATAATASEASLIGTYKSVDINSSESYKDYILSNNTIYPVSKDEQKKATINPYRAYIQIDQSTGSEARALTFFIDGQETNGIEGIEVVNSQDAPVYNLSGQRVMKTSKGLYIKNGKKIAIK